VWGDGAVVVLTSEDGIGFASGDICCGCRASLGVECCGNGEGGEELGELFEDGGVGGGRCSGENWLAGGQLLRRSVRGIHRRIDNYSDR
jgi:hypothetical protein